jgi:hypothetical protein
LSRLEDLEKNLKERYHGDLWAQESFVAQIDPHIQWSEDNHRRLERLKKDVEEFGIAVRKEFKAASSLDFEEELKNLKK